MRGATSFTLTFFTNKILKVNLIKLHMYIVRIIFVGKKINVCEDKFNIAIELLTINR